MPTLSVDSPLAKGTSPVNPNADTKIRQALQVLEYEGLSLPHGSYPGSEWLHTEADWTSLEWDPAPVDPTASPKPTWATIQDAFDRLVHARDQYILQRKIFTEAKRRIQSIRDIGGAVDVDAAALEREHLPASDHEQRTIIGYIARAEALSAVVGILTQSQVSAFNPTADKYWTRA